MRRFLLDSSLCVSCLRRKPWALTALEVVVPSVVCVSAVTVGELMLGTHLSGARERERAKVDAFLLPLAVLPFGREEALLWADLEAMLRNQGNRIEAEDGMIAATALAHGLTLVSGNRKHFERVKALKIVDWEKQPPRAAPTT